MTLTLMSLFALALEKKPQIPNESLLQNKPTQVRVNEVLTFRPVEGHHFNLKAPLKCGGFEFQTKSALKLTCQIGKPGKHKMVMGVCDEKETFCRMERFEVHTAGHRSSRSRSLKAPRKAKASKSHGFMINDPKGAQALATKDKKLLLVDFYGIWCPPCNMLDEQVFNQTAFEKATHRMVKLKLDADAQVSHEFKDHFHVGGYPTLVLADHNLNEVARLVGFRPLPQVLKWLGDHEALPPLNAIEAKIQNGTATTQERTRVAQWHLDRKEPKLALKVLTVPGLIQRKAQLQLAQVNEDEKMIINALENLIQFHGADISMASWVLDLMERAPNQAKAYSQGALASLRKWRANPKLPETGYSVADTFQIEGYLLEKLNKVEESKTAYLAAAKAYGDQANLTGRPVARGASLEQAYCLLKGGKPQEAKTLYEKLIKEYGKEFTFNYNYAWALRELKEFTKALVFAQKALNYSYGDNWLRAVAMKAKIRLALNQRTKARQELQAALKEMELPKSSQVRTHRYVAQLRTLLQKASKP